MNLIKNKHLLIIICFLSLILLIGNFKKTPDFNETPEEKQIVLYSPKDKITQNLKLEEYVLGVIAAEMPASFNKEALKAQAVAARTYAYYKIKHSNKDYDVISDISNQAYNNKEEMQRKWQNQYVYYYQKLKQVVEKTKGEVLTYQDKVILAHYFAISNGQTEDGLTVFKEKEAYLKSVDSSWDKNVKNFLVTKEFDYQKFCNILNINCVKIDIQDIKKNATNHVSSIKINNREFSGLQFRKLLQLRSTDFDINLKDKVYITTKGYGHGVGMSQYGANELAKKGYNYKEILKHYYPNVKITNINV